jgi:hypothetical protein
MKAQNADNKPWHEVTYSAGHDMFLLLIRCKRNCMIEFVTVISQSANALYKRIEFLACSFQDYRNFNVFKLLHKY